VIVHSFYHQPDVNLAYEHIVGCFGGQSKPTPEIAAQELMARKRALMVLDGAEQATDLLALLEKRGQCGTIITSQERGQGKATEWQDLPPLELEDGLKLLQDWGGEYAADEASGRKFARW
jgi:hypothetical protein